MAPVPPLSEVTLSVSDETWQWTTDRAEAFRSDGYEAGKWNVLKAEDGRRVAVQSVADGLAVGRSLVNEPLLISQLVRMADENGRLKG